MGSGGGSDHAIFRIFGPLEAEVAGRQIPLGEPQQQIVLAVMLLAAGRTVSLDRIVDAVWERQAPSTARKQVRNRVGILRRLLADAARGRELIITDRAGYRLASDGVQIDSLIFEELVLQARSHRQAGRLAEALKAFRAALRLWRGPLLSGLDSAYLRDAAASWDRRRVAAMESCLDLELNLGRHHEIVDELAGIVNEYPLSEHLRVQQMTALYRCGRPAEALAAYREIYRLLSDELGVQPSAPLQQLHQRILQSDPTLDSAPRDGLGPVLVAPALPRPAQLPAELPAFTGRKHYIRVLDSLAPSAASPASATTIIALTGTPGVGKTTLAVHWAHRACALFPDGQLYVNLRGFDRGGAPVAPEQAVRGFLTTLGFAPPQIPAELAEQAALYRTVLADRRLLVVLDNARDADQVRPLLPGGPGCLVIVTSRDQLAGLVAVEGARSLQLDLFSVDEARDFLSSRLGADRLAQHQRTVEEIISCCGRLPLALAIVGARAATRPDFPLSALVREIGEAPNVLTALDNAGTDLRGVFSWSYRTLSAFAARVFRMLGQHPGPDIGIASVASLAGVPVVEARAALAELTRAHLLTERAPSRFVLHDLLRSYAAELSATLDGDADRQSATSRLVDHYLHTAYAAARMLNPHREPIALEPVKAGVTPEHLAGYDEAMAWFTEQCQVLVAMVHLSEEARLDRSTWPLVWAMSDFLKKQGRWHEKAQAQQTALASVRRLGDRTAIAHVHLGLGNTYSDLGDYDAARVHLQHALDLYHELGDRLRQAFTHTNLGLQFGSQQLYTDALRHTRQALEIFTDLGNVVGQASALNNIGWLHTGSGRHEQALSYGEQAIALQQKAGNLLGEANAWDTLGLAHHGLGRHPPALACYDRALELYRRVNTPYREAITLGHVGDTFYAAGDPEAAGRAWQKAETILDHLNDPDAGRLRAKLRPAA